VNDGNCLDANEMDVDGNGVGSNRVSGEGYDCVATFQAGCPWTRYNWSCAYDVVFMTFFHIYQQSSESWRNGWRQQSPTWASPLANHFDILLKALHSPGNSPETLSKHFSSLRDKFRDQLSSHDPGNFPRRGQFFASVCLILELLSGSVRGPGIKHNPPRIKQNLSCTKCGMTSQASPRFPYLIIIAPPNNYDGDTDPQFVSLDTLFARFVESAPQSSRLCKDCRGAIQVQSFSMERFPWIWFEAQPPKTASPSPTIRIKSSDQDLIYDLHSIIYLGGEHFTARIRGPSNEWWSYDGMREFGSSQRDHVKDEADLLNNEGRHAAFFIYRRSDR